MDYRPIIESRYNRENWQLLLHDIFGNKIKFWHTPSVVGTSSQFAKQALWLGTITLSDGQTISVYEVELADSVDIERNRRGIRDMLLTAWRNNGNAGAFMFCYRKNESVLRFSYVSEAWAFADDGTYQKESTDTKRFTYLLGEGHRSRTAIQQFEKLRDSKLSLRDLTKAFSVDAVSDMFFDGYKKQYEDIIQYITGKRMVKVANKWEEQIKNDPCEEIMQEFARFPNPEKAVRDYVKKLMGRLVFLQFLQKKGWLGVPAGEPWGTGDREFIQNLFAQTADKDHFIDNVLEVLFNDLNTERKGDLATSSLGGGRGRLIPYLNGGLFERDATDETEFPLPAKYMQSLLDFFASYNFTIDENDPDDAEVGVDPEMLGRIFENLLEDNKDKGAFYTPKEIVSYMCRESLIAYLQTDIEDEATKEAIRQFVSTHDVNALGTNNKFRQQVDGALKNVKICDPAIGSGAFPMGLLKELFQCRTALEDISQHQAAEIKKHIIQQNIYGVDIERGAVDIARLRFWLSLIVDEETPQALPNLDFKIMQGNSLLEQYKGVDLSNITELKQDKVGNYQTTMFDDMLDVLRLDLRKKLDEYYSCTDHKRKAILKQDIINNVKLQLKEQSINVDFGDLDLSGNNQFMLWHTWFHDVFSQGGFDIVIGNPPYVRQERIGGEYKNLLIGTYPDVGNGVADLYVYFFGLGMTILNKHGLLAYITLNKYLKTKYGSDLRKTMTNNVTVDKIIDFFELPIFNASTDAAITILYNRKINIPTRYFPIKTLENLNLSKITQGDFQTTIKNESEWQFVNNSQMSILEKLYKDTLPLKEFTGDKIYYGIKTGFNKAFVIKDASISTMLLNSESSPIIKKYVRSTDISKWELKNEGKYYLVGTFPALKLNIDSYPTLKKYLLSFGIEKLEQTGKKRVINGELIEARKKTSNKWFETQDQIAYYAEFEKSKLIYIHTAKDHQFYFDTEGHYINNSCYMIVTESKFLFCFLNSKLFKYYKRLKFVAFGDGQEAGRCKLDYNKMITVPIKKEVDEKPFENLYNKIISIKDCRPTADTSALESEIDRLVYQLYGLTDEEIKIVEQS